MGPWVLHAMPFTDGDTMITMRNIVAAVDFSPVSKAVIEQAAALAAAFSAQLTLIHVAAADPAFVGLRGGPSERPGRPRTRDPARTSRTAGDGARPRGSFYLHSRDSWSRVRRRRRSSQKRSAWDADTIVVGSHGHGALHRALLGNVSEGVVRAARCPVLVVPSSYPNARGTRFRLRDRARLAPPGFRSQRCLPAPFRKNLLVRRATEHLLESIVPLVCSRRHDIDPEAQLFLSELLTKQRLIEPDCPVLDVEREASEHETEVEASQKETELGRHGHFDVRNREDPHHDVAPRGRSRRHRDVDLSDRKYVVPVFILFRRLPLDVGHDRFDPSSRERQLQARVVLSLVAAVGHVEC